MNLSVPAWKAAALARRPVSFPIDRSVKPLFFGEEQELVEEDLQSLALTSLDFRRIRFEDTVLEGEYAVSLSQRIQRLKAFGYIRLDLAIFVAICQRRHEIPKDWEERGQIIFDGSVFKGTLGLWVPSLYFDKNKKEWRQTRCTVSGKVEVLYSGPSAVIRN